MRVKRIVVGKGITTRPAPDTEEWIRRYYEVEVEFPEGEYRPEDIEDGRVWAERLIDAWLKAEEVAIPTEEELTPEELEDLPWTPYQPGSKSGWVLRNPREGHPDYTEEHREILRRLSEKIEREGSVTIGDFTYDFSGAENQFIRRRPAKR